jgi:hypothetical protein
MQYIALTIICYLLFNFAIILSASNLLALAGANFLGGIITGIYFRHEIIIQDKRPRCLISIMGAIGILLIVLGLRGVYLHFPPSLGMEAVYNGFTIASWPLFLLLSLVWSSKFKEKPRLFDLYAHLAMAVYVAFRFGIHGEWFPVKAFFWVLVAILGYCLYNISIKTADNHRATNILMNFTGGILLILWTVFAGEYKAVAYLPLVAATLLGGMAICGIVWGLGQSYIHFGKKNLATLVPLLVYDGIIISATVLGSILREGVVVWAIVTATGMLSVTALRYIYHSSRRCEKKIKCSESL